MRLKVSLSANNPASLRTLRLAKEANDSEPQVKEKAIAASDKPVRF